MSNDQPGESTLILGLMDKDEFVYDQDNNLYVITEDEMKNRLIINPKSERYKGIISNRFFVRYGKVSKGANHNEAILVKRGETTKKINLYVRVAGDNLGTKDAVIYYDLCNNAEAVKIVPSIDGSGVSIIERPLRFKDNGQSGVQVKPNLNAKIIDAEKFFKHIKIKAPVFDVEQQDLTEENLEIIENKDELIKRRKLILLAWAIFNLIPDTESFKLVRPGIKITGAPGSAKTFNSVKILSIPDPVIKEIGSKPDDLESLELALYQRWIPAFDNVNEVTQEESDKLCKAATGITMIKRKRYTDDDMITASFRRSCIVNGVSDVLTRPDAADRYIPIELQRLDASEYKADDEVLKDFNNDLPDIFGACLKILSIVLYRLNYTHQKPKIGHRLISFLEIGRIIADIIKYNHNIENTDGIKILPEYDVSLNGIDGIISNGIHAGNDFELEFVSMMNAQETSMIDSNCVASSILAYINENGSNNWCTQLTFRQFKDNILKNMSKKGLDKEPEYKQLQATDIKIFKRELMTFLKNMSSSGIDIKIIEPTPGVKSGLSASYRIKYKKAG